MLRNYDDCNKVVTNGESGAKNDIVKSGDQIVHASTEGQTHAVADAQALLRAMAIYTRGTSWKAGSWDKLVARYGYTHTSKLEAVIDATQKLSVLCDSLEEAVNVLRKQYDSSIMIFNDITPWCAASRHGKVLCHVKWLNTVTGKMISKTINLHNVRGIEVQEWNR